MTDLVEGAMDLLPAMLRGESGGLKSGVSMLEVDKPVASASFSFKLRLDFDGSICSIVPYTGTKKKDNERHYAFFLKRIYNQSL